MKYLLMASLCLIACKARPEHQEVKLQDGTPGYILDCDKTQFSNQDCLSEANRLCSGDAIILDDANGGQRTVVRCHKN